VAGEREQPRGRPAPPARIGQPAAGLGGRRAARRGGAQPAVSPILGQRDAFLKVYTANLCNTPMSVSTPDASQAQCVFVPCRTEHGSQSVLGAIPSKWAKASAGAEAAVVA